MFFFFPLTNVSVIGLLTRFWLFFFGLRFACEFVFGILPRFSSDGDRHKTPFMEPTPALLGLAVFSVYFAESHVRCGDWWAEQLSVVYWLEDVPWLRNVVTVPVQAVCIGFGGPFVDILGVSLLIVGFLLFFATHFSMKSNWVKFVTLKRATQLVTGGPFLFVRHPMYTATLALVVGHSILLKSLPALLCAIPMFFAFVSRCNAEDLLLHQRFGKQWLDFSKRTPDKLIPLIY